MFQMAEHFNFVQDMHGLVLGIGVNFDHFDSKFMSARLINSDEDFSEAPLAEEFAEREIIFGIMIGRKRAVGLERLRWLF